MNEDVDFRQFQDTLIENGLKGYLPNQLSFLWDTAKQCYRSAGKPVGVSAGLMMAGLGATVLPGVGLVRGFASGFLAGAVAGTVKCVIEEVPLKSTIDSILPKDLD